MKGISQSHVLITLLPASYQDLKQLILNPSNILDQNNNAVKLISNTDNLTDFDTETNTTEQQTGGQSSEQQVSFESSSSSLLPTPSSNQPSSTATICKLPDQNTECNEPKFSARTRFKSGPPPHTQSQPLNHSNADISYRERASSFHSSRDRSCSIGQTSSLADLNNISEFKKSALDSCRKKGIFFSSKHPVDPDAPPNSRSSETLRQDSDIPIPRKGRLSTDADSINIEDSACDSDKIIYGSATLPIYVYDCKFSSIVAQLENRYAITFLFNQKVVFSYPFYTTL